MKERLERKVSMRERLEEEKLKMKVKRKKKQDIKSKKMKIKVKSRERSGIRETKAWKEGKIEKVRQQ